MVFKALVMKYNLLGDTGLKVSELCLGTMTFGGKGIWTAIGTLPQNEVDEMVKKSVDAGINFIDTANAYSEGLSEELTGQSLRNLGLHRDDLIIATKANPIPVFPEVPSIIVPPGFSLPSASAS